MPDQRCRTGTITGAASADHAPGVRHAFDRRYRALVLLAVFCSLRWGELTALRRRHIDLASGTVCVQESVVELTDGSLVTGPPKSMLAAGSCPYLLP